MPKFDEMFWKKIFEFIWKPSKAWSTSIDSISIAAKYEETFSPAHTTALNRDINGALD